MIMSSFLAKFTRSAGDRVFGAKSDDALFSLPARTATYGYPSSRIDQQPKQLDNSSTQKSPFSLG